MSYETILFEITGGVARLALNRPDKLNSFNTKMHEEVRAALSAVEGDPDLRVLTITGAGRGFCAGQDLSDRVVGADGQTANLGESVRNNYAPMVRRIRALNLPVIAAVNGVAAGAGANLALACDLVIATKSASFIQSFAKLGLIPDTGGTWTLPRLLGNARAMGLAMLAEKLPAEQAAQWGLIWKCVEDADFASTVEQLEKQLATAPTAGLARIKHAIWNSEENNFSDQLDHEADLMTMCGLTDDYKEGVRAFLEKRAPNFTGK